MEKPEPQQVQIKVTIDDQVAQGEYVNFANILHNPTEFVLDFGRLVPGRPDARILSRMITNPIHAKQLWLALGKNIELFEQKYGSIRLNPDELSRHDPGSTPM